MQNRKIYYRLVLILALFLPVVLWSQTEEQTKANKDIQSDTLIEAKKGVQKEVQIEDISIEQPKLLGIGIKSGVTYSSLFAKLPAKNVTGFVEPSYGLILSYVDQKIVGIQIELNYVTKSWEETPVADTSFNAKLTYLEIPLLTTLHFGNKFKFLVNGGPYLSILLNEESRHNINATSQYLPYYENRTPRGGDFGLMGGAGFRLQTKAGLFQIEARYSFGFQNTYDPVKSKLAYSNMTTMSVFLSYQFLFSHDRP